MGKHIHTRTHPSLDVVLATSSSRFVRRAFACHEQSDWEGFIVNAGIAVELLAKAVLAKVNPLLIARPNSEHSIITLAKLDPKRRIPTSARTVGAELALQRAHKIGVPLNRYENDLQALREARNQIVHSGIFDQEVIERSYDGWIRSMVALTEYAAYRMQLIFGASTDLVDVQMVKYEDNVERLWELRRSAAHQRWEAERALASGEYIELKRSALEAELISENSVDPSLQWIVCPVCRLPARLYGEFDAQPDYDVKGDEVFISGTHYEFVPKCVRCQVCGLNLDSSKLVEQSGVLDSWEPNDDDSIRWARLLEEDWIDNWS